MILLLSLLCFVSVSYASGEAEEAEISFQLGLAAYTEGQYDLALSRFLTSNRLAPNPAVAFNIARCYARSDRYAESYRWYTIAQEGLSDKAILRSVQEGLAAITPQVVVYELTSIPEGASIYVDSRDLGTVGVTPLRLALAPSREARTFVFEKSGYEDAVVNTTKGQRGESVSLEGTLRQIVGTIAIQGTEEATVHIGTPDGPVLCTTPCEGQLEPGSRVLYVRREGFRDTVLQIEIVADERAETTVALAPNTGVLLVDASERGALVEIDGRAAGYTPVVVQSVAVGIRKVRISRPGFAPVEREIEVLADRQIEAGTVELLPLNEVSAVSRRAERASLAPSSVSVISRDELEAFRYPTIYEALRGVRGFALTYDSIYGTAAVRGLGQANDFGNRLLTLSDGAILNDNILYQSFISYDGRSDLAGLEQIEIVRGPGSVLYGTGAVSGVVNLVGQPLQSPTQTTVTVSAFEQVFQGGATSHYSKGIFGFRASAAAAASPGQTQTLSLREGAGSQTVKGFDRFEGASTSGRIWLGDATLQWYHSWRTIHIPTGVYGTLLATPDTNRWNDQRSLAELRYEPKLSDTVRLLTRAYGNRYNFAGYYPYDGYLSIEQYLGVSVGAEARVIAELSKPLRLQAGLQGEVSPIIELDGEDQLDDGTVSSYLDETRPYHIVAGYALVDFVPIELIRFMLGARVDQWSTFGASVSPRSALVLVPSATDVVKVMAGRAFRAPSIYELYYNIPGAQLSPDFDGTVLLPETVWSGEIEYNHSFDDVWTGLVAVHGSQATDLIETVQAPGQEDGVITYRNSDLPIRIIGGDVELRRAFQGGYMVSAFYSALDSRYSDGTLVPNAPQHNTALKVVLPIARPTGRLATRICLEAPRRIDLSRTDTTDLAVVADMVVSGGLADLGFDYAFGLYNLLDMSYQQPVTDTFPFRTVPQRGRSVLVSLSKRL